jgi:hypothetical protein
MRAWLLLVLALAACATAPSTLTLRLKLPHPDALSFYGDLPDTPEVRARLTAAFLERSSFDHLDAMLQNLAAFDRTLAEELAERLAASDDSLALRYSFAWHAFGNQERICAALLDGQEFLLFMPHGGGPPLVDVCDRAVEYAFAASERYPYAVSRLYQVFGHRAWAPKVLEAAIANSQNTRAAYVFTLNPMTHLEMVNLHLARGRAPDAGESHYRLYRDAPAHRPALQSACRHAATRVLAGRPRALLEGWQRIQECDYGGDLLEAAARACAGDDPEAVLAWADLFSSRPWFREVRSQAIRELLARDPAAIVPHIPSLGVRLLAPSWFERIAAKRPDALLDNHDALGPGYDLELMTLADSVAGKYPRGVVHFGRTVLARSLRRAKKLVALRDGLVNAATIEEQWQTLDAQLGDVAPAPWRPVSFLDSPSTVVFANLDALGTAPLQFSKPGAAWPGDPGTKERLPVDLPRAGATAVMLMAYPEHLQGIDTDFAAIESIYEEVYRAHILDRLYAFDRNPARDLASGGMLARLRTALERAVDSGASAFVLHYHIHGHNQGALQLGSGLTRITPVEKVAAVLTDAHHGRRFVDSLDIVLVAESCYAGRQLDRLARALEKREPPARRLVAIGTSRADQPSFAGLVRENATVVSPTMGADRAGAFSYYWVLYHELVAAHGGQAHFGDAITFASRLAERDSAFDQELQVRWIPDLPGGAAPGAP